MRFRIFCTDGGKEWSEEYNKDVADANKWAADTIEYFNDTLRPGENPRKLIKVEVLENSNEEFHRWVKRTDGMSVIFRGKMVDLMFCEKCRITGKKYGLSGNVIIDSKFRKKAFKKCNTAMVEMSKRDI